jgi:AsmA protein
MKRFLKIVGIIFLVLIVLIGGTFIYLALTVDMEHVKQHINTEVQKQTGRELVIDGDINLSFFPWIGLEIGETHLGNAAGFRGDFASFKNARASIKLLPLFSKTIEMSTLSLDGFVLNLYQRKDGVNNWDDLKGPTEVAPAEVKPTERGSGPMTAGLLLDGVELNKANITYRDDASGAVYSLTDFSLTTKQIGLKRDIPFNIDFKVNLNNPAMVGRYDIKGIANIDSAGLINIRDIVFTSNMDIEGRPVSKVATDLKTNLSFDQGSMRITLDPFDFAAELQGEGLPEQPTKLGVSTIVDVDMARMAVSLKPLTLAMPGSTANGEFNYRQQNNLKLIDFNLAFDQIDLARIATPTSGETEVVPTAKPAGTSADGSNGALRSLVVNGDITVDKIVQEQLLVSDVVMLIKMRDSQLRINPFTATLYGGLTSNDITIDLRLAVPRIKAIADLKGFQIGEYLKSAMDKDIITGTANVTADVNLTAADPDTLKRSLNGNVVFNVRDGALKEVNIPEMIRRAKAALSGQPLPTASVQQTDFTELSGTAIIIDGLVHNDDLLMKSPLMRISGTGEASLPTEQINYLVTTKLVATLKGQQGEDLKDLVGVPIPIRITGSFAEPDWTVDLKSVFAKELKSQAKGAFEKALKDPQKITDDPSELLGEPTKSFEGIKKLFE